MTAMLVGVHPVLAASDVTASVQFYARLGFTLVFQDQPTEPKYAVVRRDGVELHMQWAGADQWAHPVDRPLYRFIVSDVDALYREFVGSGMIGAATGKGSPWAAPGDTPWGTREFHLRDPGQNGLQFYCVL
jgi:catechol 2,3-dioxygenase-like lactoylglutathione lyase family enzyme